MFMFNYTAYGSFFLFINFQSHKVYEKICGIKPHVNKCVCMCVCARVCVEKSGFYAFECCFCPLQTPYAL